MIAAVAGVPLETVGCIALFALAIGLCVGVEVMRPWQPPSQLRRRQLDRLMNENGVDRSPVVGGVHPQPEAGRDQGRAG